VPPVIIDATASIPSMPTTYVPIAEAGSRGVGDGIACTNTASSRRWASVKNARNRSSPIEVPSTLDAISTPCRPWSRIAFSSEAAASGSCIGTMPSPIRRSGAAAHSCAVHSLTCRASESPSAAGRS
jgi:hypothetical protein